MFDQHRKFDSCVFCGSAKVTSEHLFGAAIAKHLQAKHNWRAYSFETDGSLIERKGSGPILSIQPRAVCGRCNNERLSRELDRALPTLKDLFRGTKSAIPRRNVYAVRRYWERFALLMDVCTSNRDIESGFLDTRDFRESRMWRQHPPIYDDSVRNQWLGGAKVDGLQIRIGHHPGVLGIDPDVLSTQLPHCIVAQLSGKRFLLAIGHLAVVMQLRDDSELPGSFIECSDKEINWPPSTSVTYDDYYSVPLPTLATATWKDLFRDPAKTKAFEDYTRKHGKRPDDLDEIFKDIPMPF